MRKCRSCGYFLLGEGDSCMKCGAPLVAVTAGAPAPAAAVAPSAAPGRSAPPAWGAPPASGAPTPPTPPPAPVPVASPLGRLSWPPPPSTPADAVPPLRQPWQPVSMRAPAAPARSTRSGLLAVGVVLLLAVAAVFGAGVLHLGSGSLPAGTSAFVAGKGISFTSPDGVYQARFPTTPTFESAPQANGLTLDRAYSKSDSYEVVAVSSIASAAVPGGSVNILLEAGLAAEIANLHGKLQSKNTTTFQGMPAIEAHFKGADGYDARIIVLSSGTKIFEAVVHAKSGADRLFKAFEASLTIY